MTRKTPFACLNTSADKTKSQTALAIFGTNPPVAVGALSAEKLHTELMTGFNSILYEKNYSIAEVDAILAELYEI